MKTQRILLLALLAILLLAGAPQAVAVVNSGYSIDWYTVDGGGGASSGGGYTLTGTAGQPDAGSQSGGGYLVAGGFWADLSEVRDSLFLPLVAR